MGRDSKKSVWNELANWDGSAPKIVFVLMLSLLLGSVSELHAQEKYNPDHPEVEAMVNKAVKYLESKPSNDLGKVILAGLAVVEARKRYYQEIPSTNPVVTSAIKKILEAIPAEGGSTKSGANLYTNNELYVPSLALILLAEVDQSKYKEPIKGLIKSIQDRQEKSGAYTYLRETGQSGDTSQTQYAALALYVAKHHGFAVNPNSPRRALQWLTDSQQSGGFFLYKVKPGGQGWVSVNRTSKATLSIHAAGLGTIYLLSDLLQLTARRKSMSKVAVNDEMVGLPKTVSPYIKPVDGEDSLLNQLGPLVDFDMGRLNNSWRGGNAFFEKNFNIAPKDWTFYYLYALERYAWFREQAEGDLGSGKISGWYDAGVNFLKTQQENNGSFYNNFPSEDHTVATAFAVLFLVRSSEVISLPSNTTEMLGGEGFPTNQQISSKGGQLIASDAEKNLSQMINMLQQDPTPEQLEALTKSMKKAVVEFKNKDDKSRGAIKSFLRTMIAAPNYYRRKIAVRFLAGEQDMDNVPALIYALGDPDFRVCLEAHDGLRLISRKIDSLSLSDQTRKNAVRDPDALASAEETSVRMEFDSLKKRWAEWFLTIRPDAELLD